MKFNHILIARKAEEGTQALNSGRFPNEQLQDIRDARVRKDIYNRIFYPNDSKQLSELDNLEKKARSERLKVELAFNSFISGMDAFRKSALVFLFVGAVMLMLTKINTNGNLIFGVVTTIQGLAILLIGIKNRWIYTYITTILFILFGLSALELIIIGMPYPVLFGDYSNYRNYHIGAFWRGLNFISPYLYLGFKMVSMAIILKTKLSVDAFGLAKKHFESTIKIIY
ncbi:MAG: hypothetical protein ACI865_002584 [Flavobacteriaceae bacterium]|jgi:hypothetical protein